MKKRIEVVTQPLYAAFRLQNWSSKLAKINAQTKANAKANSKAKATAKTKANTEAKVLTKATTKAKAKTINPTNAAIWA